jgi:hypothetical protein
MKIYIYTLSDPITEEVKYVGRTRHKLSVRLSGHISKGKSNHGTYKRNWIKSLEKKNLKPVIQLLEELDCSWVESHEIEKHWISQLYVWGYKLTNCEDKGIGSLIKPYNGHSDKSVLQYTLDGIFIKEYPSAREASRATNAHWKNISNCCNGNKKTHLGFMWKFKTNNVVDAIIDKVKPSRKGKPVYQINKLHEVVKLWGSTVEAATSLGIRQCGIASAANPNTKDRSYKGYTWKYLN